MKPIPRAFRHLGVTLGLWAGFRVLVAAAPEFYPETVVMRSGIDNRFANVSRRTPSPLSEVVNPGVPVFTSSMRRDVVGQSRLFENVISKLPNVNLAPVPMRVMDGAQPNESKKLPAENLASITNLTTPAPIPVPARIDDWSLSAFAIYRPNSGPASLSPTSQLGGSQFGFRAQRLLFQPSRNLALSLNLRGSTPLKVSNGKEAGLGLAIRRAGRVPIELIAERRVAFDRGGRNAFAGLIATGFNDLPTVAGFNLNGYAQAGIVGLRRRDGFVDGSLRLDRKIASKGSLAAELGGGIWGAVQPGVSRVDIGPSAAIRFRIGSAGVRLGSEWRQRVSGNARPGSGPAITFGLDY